MEILFSPGVVKHPMLSGDHLHTAPLVPLHKHLTCKQVVDTLNAAIGEGRPQARAVPAWVVMITMGVSDGCVQFC